MLCLSNYFIAYSVVVIFERLLSYFSVVALLSVSQIKNSRLSMLWVFFDR